MSTDAERREEARMETIDEQLDRRGVTCEDCAYRWIPGRQCCPRCGGNIADPDEAMFIIDMSRVAQLVRDQGHACFCEQSGGGCATIYAGKPVETDDGPEYPVLAGPGSFYPRPTGDRREFVVGPPDGYPSEDFTECDRLTDEEIASAIVEALTK